jgi:hypothetical protein
VGRQKLCRIRQEVVAPLLIEGLTALMFGTNLGHRLTLETLKDGQSFGLGIPLPSLHG